MAPGSEDAASRAEGPTRGTEGASLSPLLPGVALAVAFSPVLVDLARHLWAEPWARSMLVVPFLLWRAARVDRPAAAPTLGRPIALAIVALALGVQVVAIGGDALRWARLGLVASIAVSLWATGKLGIRGAVLAFWLLPVPSFLVDALSPGLEVAMGHAAATFPGLAFEARPFDPALSTAGARLSLQAVDGGLALSFGLAGLGWARGVFDDRSGGALVRTALLAGGLGLPVQLLVLLVSAGLVSAVAGAEAGRSVLDHAGAAIVVIGGLALVLFAGSDPRRREASGTREGVVPC